MDATDKKILSILIENSRESASEIAKRVSLSVPAARSESASWNRAA